MRLLKEVQNLMGSYHVKSGMYHYYRNEYKQASEFLVKALNDPNLTEADRRNARYYLTLALLDQARRLRDSGETDEALETLRQASEVSPDYPDIHFQLGQMLERMGRLDDAIAEHRAATRCQEQFLDAHVSLAFCLLSQEKRDEAAEAFRVALKIKQLQIETPFHEAMTQLQDGDLQRASDTFHDVFRAVPELANACLKKALDWLKAEEHEKALAELDRAIERNPKYPDLHNFRGVVLFELEREEEAIEAFRLSSSLKQRYLVPRLNLAFSLAHMGQYKLAEAELERVLELDPEEPAATAMLEELSSDRAREARRKASRGGPR
jgi:tetratricopeptide (TPR) repeat protein